MIITKKAEHRTLNRIVLAVSILNPFANLPQLITILNDKDATSVSTISWSLFAVASVTMFIYGLTTKDKPVIIMFGLLAITQAAVAVASIIY